jgi:hypothetical protein
VPDLRRKPLGDVLVIAPEPYRTVYGPVETG